MKKVILMASVIGLGACQQSATQAPLAAAKRFSAAVVLPDSLAPFKKYDLSALFRMGSTEDDTLTFQPQEGCFGPEGYLLEVALLKVRRDSLQPTTYWVQGKRRFKKTITRFSGKIQLNRLLRQRKYLRDSSEFMGYSDYGYYKKLVAYTATGTFMLREEAAHPGAGSLQGVVALDFSSKAKGELARECLTLTTPTQMGELKFKGTWRGNTGQPVQPVMWLGSFLSYQGAGALQDLLITDVGERGAHLNPKYTKLGWNEAWQHDEWWADSPKLHLSL